MIPSPAPAGRWDKKTGDGMKYIMVVLAGAGDHPAEEIGGKTVFEVAKIPNLNHFSKIGKVGQAKLSADRLDPGPDSSLLNSLGYDADKVYTGRGPIEAANLELKLESNEVAFRMNFITEADGLLADATGGKISTKEAKAMVNFLNKKISSDFVRFFAGAEYRHIAVLKDSHGIAALSAKTEAPESITGERIDAHLPKGPGEELLKKLMFDAKLLLQDHEINQVRVDLGENPANMIWLWGQGQRPQFEKFSELSGLTGAMVADIEFAKGIARISGLTVVENPDSSLDEDARLEKMTRAALEVLAERDFVCLYLDGCDHAARAGNFKGKVSALEAIDFFALSKIKDYLDKNMNTRVLVTPGYGVPWQLKKQTRDTVPFVVAGKNIMSDDIEKFSENTAKASALKANKGSELMKLFIQEAKVAV